jgi:hypothetical protein
MARSCELAITWQREIVKVLVAADTAVMSVFILALL